MSQNCEIICKFSVNTSPQTSEDINPSIVSDRRMVHDSEWKIRELRPLVKVAQTRDEVFRNRIGVFIFTLDLLTADKNSSVSPRDHGSISVSFFSIVVESCPQDELLGIWIPVAPLTNYHPAF